MRRPAPSANSSRRRSGPIRVLVLHGPNLNLLGERQPEVYGTVTLGEIDLRIEQRARELGVEVRAVQSNVEGDLVTAIQEVRNWADGIVINAAGYSHTSVAIRDAISAVRIPTVEVHLSNPAAREEFRRAGIVAEACTGVVAGFGWRSYVLALEALAAMVGDASDG
ncbi:MAG TPA: type II 3-dehydroquinate dehydratase [Actinomycetota bacterium]|nr:type II 3-dehydroquinate dehydratase [Actinomycetota bacterium]